MELSSFAQGLIMGGPLSGTPASRPMVGVDFVAMAENDRLKKAMVVLEADAVAVYAVRDALIAALIQENPDHPLVNPFKEGEGNPLRVKIYDEAYDNYVGHGPGM